MQVKEIWGAKRIEILCADDFDAQPITIGGTHDVIKAGTPITASGEVATDQNDCVGLLLYDVDPTVNPVGAVVIRGVINARIARQYSGVDLNAEILKFKCPALILREDAPLRYTNFFKPTV